MSRIDIFGDRICVVTSLLIVGWFIYNVAFWSAFHLHPRTYCPDSSADAGLGIGETCRL